MLFRAFLQHAVNDFEQLLASSSSSEGNPCLAADLNCDGTVDATDLDLFNAAWQDPDVNGDGIVNGNDLD